MQLTEVMQVMQAMDTMDITDIIKAIKAIKNTRKDAKDTMERNTITLTMVVPTELPTELLELLLELWKRPVHQVQIHPEARQNSHRHGPLKISKTCSIFENC